MRYDTIPLFGYYKHCFTYINILLHSWGNSLEISRFSDSPWDLEARVDSQNRESWKVCQKTEAWLDRIVESWFRGITLCVAFFTWNVEPFSSRIVGRSDDSVLPFRLVLLHCLVRWMLNFSYRTETSRNERQRHQITIFILYDSFCSFYVIPSLRYVL